MNYLIWFVIGDFYFTLAFIEITFFAVSEHLPEFPILFNILSNVLDNFGLNNSVFLLFLFI